MGALFCTGRERARNPERAKGGCVKTRSANESVKRRDFLKRTIMAGDAVAAPMMVPSRVLGLWLRANRSFWEASVSGLEGHTS